MSDLKRSNLTLNMIINKFCSMKITLPEKVNFIIITEPLTCPSDKKLEDNSKRHKLLRSAIFPLLQMDLLIG